MGLPLPSRPGRAAVGLAAEKTVWQLAEALAYQQPERITHIFDETPCRLGEIVADAISLSTALAARGFSAGDVVAFQLPNWREALIVDLACVRLGIAVAPIVPIYRDAELVFMLGDCRARAIFVPGRYRETDFTAMARRLQSQLPELRDVFPVRTEIDGCASYERLLAEGGALASSPAPWVDPDAVKLVLYTSGTTGRPKAVLHSHNTRGRGSREPYIVWEQGEGDWMLMASPITHITGFGSGLELPFYTPLRALLMEKWDAARAVALIDQHRLTISVGATPFLKELLDAAEKTGSRLPSLLRFVCGGAQVPPELIRRCWSQLANCRAFRVYGSSEVPLVTLGFSGDGEGEPAAATDGRIAGYEVRIIDEEGRVVGHGVDGEICAKGPAMMIGYLDETQTTEAFDEDGFFRTGDIGRTALDGSLQITDRKKDLINRGGEKISAKEVEDILDRHPSIAEVAVIAVPHSRLGETACACVVLKPDRTLNFDSLAQHVADAGVARQKIPERLEILAALPKTPSGKIRKDLLRRRFAGTVERASGA